MNFFSPDTFVGALIIGVISGIVVEIIKWFFLISRKNDVKRDIKQPESNMVPYVISQPYPTAPVQKPEAFSPQYPVSRQGLKGLWINQKYFLAT